MRRYPRAWQDFCDDLSRVDARRRALEREIQVCVSAARAAGVPWSMIGAALGITKQSAHERFGK